MKERIKRLSALAIEPSLVLLVLLILWVPSTNVKSSESTVLPISSHAGFIHFLNDSEHLLVIDSFGSTVEKVNVASGSRENIVELSEGEFNASITDIVQGPDLNFLYMVGEELNSGVSPGKGLLARYNLKTGEFTPLWLQKRFLNPSLAVSKAGTFYVGSQDSSAITVIRGRGLWETKTNVVPPDNLDYGIFVEKGPVRRIGQSLNEQFLLVSHSSNPAISLVDVVHSEVVDLLEVWEVEKRVYPFEMFTPVDHSNTVLFADYNLGNVVTSQIDNDIQGFNNTNLAPLVMRRKSDETSKSMREPLLVAADANLKIIIVVDRPSRRITVLAQSESSTLERRGVIELNYAPADLEVSRNGKYIALLHEDRRSIEIIEDVFAWSSRKTSLAGSDKTRELQRSLALLGYPIDTIDGLQGDNTRAALMNFQKAAGLVVSGRFDGNTKEALDSVISELPAVPMSFERAVTLLNQVSSGNVLDAEQCQIMDEKSRCTQVGINSRSGNSFVTYLDDRTFELVCESSSNVAFPIQVDVGVFLRNDRQYICTTFHSCAYIRYRNIAAYSQFCSNLEQ
ncbi:MAG: peptidoglycan-binding domain-containing protein [Pseudomonadota bacterium]